MTNIIARMRVQFGRTYWVGGITKHKGHPFIVHCTHEHPTRAEAKDCAEAMCYSDEGSQTADLLRKHGITLAECRAALAKVA